MGSVRKIICPCGFKSQVSVGGTMKSFREYSTFPFYCEKCGLVEVNIAKEFPAVRLFNPTPELCPKNNCIILEKGRNLYTDKWHLSEYGSQKLLPSIRKILVNLLNQ